MADNITFSGTTSTPPANTVVATDEVGSAHYQIIKIALGTDGSASLLGLGQQAMANSMPVALASNQTAIPVSGSVSASGTFPVTQSGVWALNTSSSTIGATQDAGPSWTTTLGVSGCRVSSSDMSTITSITDAPTSGQKLVIDDIIVSTAASMSVNFKEETTGTTKLTLFMPSNGVAQITPRSKFKLDTADKKLQAQASTSGSISITALYHSEA